MPFLLYGYTDVRVLCANNNNTHTNGRRKESVWRNRLLSLTHSFLLTPFPPLPPWFINQKKPEKKPFAFFLFLRLRFHFAPAHTRFVLSYAWLSELPSTRIVVPLAARRNRKILSRALELFCGFRSPSEQSRFLGHRVSPPPPNCHVWRTQARSFFLLLKAYYYDSAVAGFHRR